MEPMYEILRWIVEKDGLEPNPSSLNISREEFNQIVYDLEEHNYIKAITGQSTVVKKGKKGNTYKGVIWLSGYEATSKGKSTV